MCLCETFLNLSDVFEWVTGGHLNIKSPVSAAAIISFGKGSASWTEVRSNNSREG